MPAIESPPPGAHARASRQRKRKEPEVVDERTARLQKRMVSLTLVNVGAHFYELWCSNSSWMKGKPQFVGKIGPNDRTGGTVHRATLVLCIAVNSGNP